MKNLLITSSVALCLTLPAYAGDTEMKNVQTETEQALDATGTAISNTAEDAGQAIENTATDIAEGTENAVDATKEMAADATETFDGPAVAVDGFETAAHATVTAEELTGVAVYDAKQEWIGEIDSVVLSTDGDVEGAVVGVGGFLGIGEKDVMLKFSDLSMMKEVEGEELRAYVDVTQETLEAMPSYEQS